MGGRRDKEAKSMGESFLIMSRLSSRLSRLGFAGSSLDNMREKEDFSEREILREMIERKSHKRTRPPIWKQALA